MIKKSIIILLLILFISGIYLTHSDASDILRVHFIDVGFGDAILLQLPNDKVAMIDAGDRMYSQIVLDYLKKQGIERIDFAILTHPHKNHFGGFIDILKDYALNSFYYNGDEREVDKGYDTLMAQLKNRSLSPHVLRQGDVIFQEGSLRMEVLHPASLQSSTNNDSLVTWLHYGETTFAFTADVEPKQFIPLLKQFPQLQEADLLQIPHHGLEIEQLNIELMRNKIWVASVKEYEVSKSALRFLSSLKRKTLTTAEKGHVVIESDGKNISVGQK